MSVVDGRYYLSYEDAAELFRYACLVADGGGFGAPYGVRVSHLIEYKDRLLAAGYRSRAEVLDRLIDRVVANKRGQLDSCGFPVRRAIRIIEKV